MAVNANWAKMSSATGGSANLTLTAIGSYPSFTQAFGNTNTQVYYVVSGPTQREAGVGTYYPTNTTAGTLSRDEIVESWDGGASFGNGTINFSTIGVDVFCGPIAQYVVHTGTPQTITGIKTFSNALNLSGAVNAASVTITANVFSGNGATLTSLNASAVTSGTIAVDRLDGNVILTTSTTGINASALSSGTVPIERLTAANLTSNGIITTGTQTFEGNKTFNADVTITGNLTLLGQSTSLNVNNVIVTDSLIQLAANNTTSDAIDIGLYGNYNPDGGDHEHTGLFRDASDGVWKLFVGLQESPTTTVNTSGVGYAIGTLQSYLTSTIFGTNSSALTITANSSYSASLTINTLSVSGATNVLSTLGVTGTVTALGQLNVTGNATFDTSTLVVDATNNRVGINLTTPDAPLHAAGDIMSQTSLAASGSYYFQSRKSRGSVASPTAIVDGDDVGGWLLLGYDGTNWQSGAAIVGSVNGTVAANSVPMDLSLYAGVGAPTSDTKRLTIVGSTGTVSIANTLTLNTTNGRFVLPVGTDKWAT